MRLYRCIAFYFYAFLPIVYSFTPATTAFDAYGPKLAANDVLLAESISSASSFLLRLAPFNYSLTCTIAYQNSSQYVYAVALQSHVTLNDTVRFVFIGVDTNTDVPFIGSLTYTGVTGAAYVAAINATRKVKFPCTGWQKNNYRIHRFNEFRDDLLQGSGSNSFFVVTVAPTGQVAYAFTNTFLVIYDLERDTTSSQLGNSTWPDASFLPRAVDVSEDSLLVLFGYVGSSDSQYTPCAYLLNVSNSTFSIVDAWLYTPPTATSWQASITNWDADVYASKYDMSVRMNDAGDKVLLGIQIMNAIVLLDINRINQKFGTSSQTLSNGKAIGMGKTVAWLAVDLIVVLVNTYSLNYVWSSSQVFVYNVSVANTFVVASIFPNIQQTLAATFGPTLLSLAATKNGTTVLLDSQGNYYILLPTPAGSFSDSSSGTSSSSSLCIAGTFTSQWGILPCSLCPPSTSTNGLRGQSACVACANDSFCSLGAAFGDVSRSSSLLQNANQARAYPVSPQSIRFDNILIENMFVIHSSTSRCFVRSPLFWALIAVVVGLFIWLSMFIVKRYVANPLGKKTHQQMERFLKKTDLIGEGEMVIGGLFSFAILILALFAYTFSNSYFHRYPVEHVHEGANFACDETMTNAQFSSGLMPLGIPPTDDEEPIFALLDAQPLTLYIDFINTIFNCTDVSVSQIKDINIQLAIDSCNDSASTVSLSLLLPSHEIDLQVALAGTHTIGAFRLGFQGDSVEYTNASMAASYTLQHLAFAQTLAVTNRLLTQQATCTVQLTKVINRTYPLEEHGETQFSALWLPTLSTSLDKMFVDESEYKFATSTSTSLSIVISETPYYALNIQKPITAQQELVFTNLLYTIVCLEIFGLGFLLFKLIIIPFAKWIIRTLRCRRSADKLPTQKSSLTEELDTRF